MGHAEEAAPFFLLCCISLCLTLPSPVVATEGFLRREQLVLVLPCNDRCHVRGESWLSLLKMKWMHWALPLSLLWIGGQGTWGSNLL